jgi:hypothetical protein
MMEPSTTARVLHNLGLATSLGGALFGQLALNPSVDSIGDKRERGRVLNESWSRYSAINAAALAATVLAWRAGGIRAANKDLGRDGLVALKDVLLGGAVANAAASTFLGLTTAKEAPEDAPEGGTPIESAGRPAPETPKKAAVSQRLVNFVSGPGAIALLAGAAAVSTVLEASDDAVRVDLRRFLS